MTNTETQDGIAIVTITAESPDAARREQRYASLGADAIEVTINTAGNGFSVAWAGCRGQRWSSARKTVRTEAAARRLADAKWGAMRRWLSAAVMAPTDARARCAAVIAEARAQS